MDANAKREEMARWTVLPLCHKEAENLSIILTCDGAASVGQVGHEVAVRLTKEKEGARMCCVTAVGAGSTIHIDIARRARKLIAINGCGNRCTGKILENLDIKPTYEITLVKEGIQKIATLDFDMKDVDRIADKITREVLEK